MHKNDIEAICPICKGRDFKTLLVGKDYLHGKPGEFPVVQCNTCSLAYIHPQPSLKEISGFYPDNYYAYTPEVPSALSGWKKVESRIRNRKKAEVATTYYNYPRKFSKNLFYKILSLISHKLDDLPYYIPDGTLLDIGCGKGTYLQEMKKMGWNTIGVEFSESGTLAARKSGLTVIRGSLEDAQFDDASIDFARMADVLEHLPNPTRSMKELHRILKPGGLVRIGVPNLKSATFSLFGKYWFPLEIPRHLFFYSPASLRLLSEKSGFEVVSLKIWAHKEVDTIPSIQYWLDDKHPKLASVFRSKAIQKTVRKVIYPLKAIATVAGYGSGMTIILRKPLA